MFVERSRGQVGLTVGPFPGDLYAHHTINVVETSDGVVVMDKLRLAKEEEYSSLVYCCGLCNAVQSCWMPVLDGHKELALTSMHRLRFLMERGEARVDTGTLQYEDHNGVSTEPLLS